VYNININTKSCIITLKENQNNEKRNLARAARRHLFGNTLDNVFSSTTNNIIKEMKNNERITISG
jgi:hypothetical protein